MLSIPRTQVPRRTPLVSETIPDLWRANDASRLYSLYFGLLQMHHRHERIIAVCPRIRRYAARGPGPEEGLFTFFNEINALCELGKYQAAWRRLRLRDKMAFGKSFDLRNRKWTGADAWELTYSYAPQLYLLGRYRQGCELLETALRFYFRRRKVQSLDMLCHIYNGDDVPSHRFRVTLSHFYRRLGKDLRQWRYWARFIDGWDLNSLLQSRQPR